MKATRNVPYCEIIQAILTRGNLFSEGLGTQQPLELEGDAADKACVAHDYGIATPHSNPSNPSYLSSSCQD